mmetsp:Transcript_759/g.1119  ORF Transcript_759/g.1119 Transcript_759/m.1119 type:complete len:226 (+) Transcript_759:1397-2074(+)
MNWKLLTNGSLRPTRKSLFSTIVALPNRRRAHLGNCFPKWMKTRLILVARSTFTVHQLLEIRSIPDNCPCHLALESTGLPKTQRCLSKPSMSSITARTSSLKWTPSLSKILCNLRRILSATTQMLRLALVSKCRPTPKEAQSQVLELVTTITTPKLEQLRKRSPMLARPRTLQRFPGRAPLGSRLPEKLIGAFKSRSSASHRRRNVRHSWASIGRPGKTLRFCAQ